MNVKKATKEYERWLGDCTTLDQEDLDYKHQQMGDKKHAFPFLRATFYRWMQIWPEVCPELNEAPNLLAVGDLHIENFGTWRDAEGRLVWGINDFDEAYPLPYTIDLVRLVVSVMLAVKASPLEITPDRACETVLSGYMEGLTKGGRPFVLEEKHPTLSALALSNPRDPVRFWRRMLKVLDQKEPGIPADAREALAKMLPDTKMVFQLRRRRRVGLGSLGKPRFVALANWAGGMVAREAKALTPSACSWVNGKKGGDEIKYGTIVGEAVRCPDPFLKISGRWLIRRLAPDCSRIELPALATVKYESRLLFAMGNETANVHLGTANSAGRVLDDLNHRPKGWLLSAAKAMAKAVRKDWKEWKRREG